MIKRTLLVGGIAIAALAFAQQAAGPRIGAVAPAFTLPDSNGKSHNLKDFSGKYVVLEWTNHQCPFVVKHYKNGDMQATQKWAADKGVVWLTILSSAPGKQGFLDAAGVNSLRKEQGFQSAATLLDPQGTVGRAYAARTTPHMFVIDPKGTVIYMGAIDSNSSANPADIKGARNHVRAALEEAMAGKAVSIPSSQPYGCSVKYPD
ncbi:MAG: thioredoxin family protein [Fimbriimonadaceae bacterium]|nr:thioredoxin family protein [Fimbriimonadaceae bacterium]